VPQLEDDPGEDRERFDDVDRDHSHAATLGTTSATWKWNVSRCNTVATSVSVTNSHTPNTPTGARPHPSWIALPAARTSAVK
jgi:hypothetical protein